jgi:uncharacterized protein (DUF2267 family)
MKKTKGKSEAASAAPQVKPEGKEAKPAKFVVVRDGYRVSDKEYATANDEVAINERDFWTRVANNASYGEPVAIVQYDSKKHRVW